MTASRTLHPSTIAVHAGAAADAETGAVSPPIHMATTFRHEPAGERVAGFEYPRAGNPTQDRPETALSAHDAGAAGRGDRPTGGGGGYVRGAVGRA